MEESKMDSDSIVHLATRNRNSKGKSSNSKGNTYNCTHCEEEGHSKQRCYEIIGYPDWWEFTKKPRKKISQASVATSSKEELPLSVVAHTKTVNNSEDTNRRTLFSLKEMDLESTQNNVVAKLPLLKQDDSEMWKLIIEQYFQVQDYALWGVIENGNSFKPVPRTTTNAYVSAVSTPVSTVSSHNNTANISYATVYAFLANQPNGSQLVHEDLEKIHEDDLEEIDLKWHFALLSMRARRYFQKTGKTITINGSDTAGNQESEPRNQDNLRKTVNVEDISSKAMVAIDEAGFDWSYMADDEVPTNMALMAFSDSKHLEFKGYGPKDSKSVCIDTSNEIKKTLDAPIIKDWVSDSDEDKYEEMVLKSDNVQYKPEQANQPRKMVQKPVLKNVENKSVQREVRPVWNNAMRTNHQNFSNSKRNFAPTAVLTKSGIVPISTARQSFSRAVAPVSAARPINIAASKPLVIVVKPRHNALQITHSLSRRPFYQQTAFKNINLNNNVNAAKANSVNTAKENKVTSVVGNQWINAVKSS
nr:putative RNA-directed DNA polymerase [Tanacetum cinerariifolium]